MQVLQKELISKSENEPETENMKERIDKLNELVPGWEELHKDSGNLCKLLKLLNQIDEEKLQ